LRRYLSLDLHRLATDRLTRARLGPRWRCAAHEETFPDALAPLAIVGRRNNADRLIALNESAERAGLRIGQALADARAILPALEVAAEDAVADGKLLAAVADWCDRYTPLVAIDPPPQDADAGLCFGLVLDITGCAHLFGGEAALGADLLARLFSIGFAARAAIAPTPGAAWALARFGIGAGSETVNHCTILDPDEIATALAPLPVAALRIDAATVSGLARLGLRRIGQLVERPRAPVARRFGRSLLARLDRALGLEDEPVNPRLPAPLLSAERRLAEPVTTAPEIIRLVERLAGHLQKSLEVRGEGARLLDLALWRLDGHVARLGVGASLPLRDPQKIVRLFGERLAALGESSGGSEDFDPGFGFEMIRLSVRLAARLDETQRSLLAGNRMDGAETATLAELVDRLGARLGPDRVAIARPADTHLPERAETVLPVFVAGLPERTLISPLEGEIRVPARPLRLFERPEPVEAMAEIPDGPPLRFRWRRLLRQVVRAEGPERIADEWWQTGQERPIRDYFRIEDTAGRRYWLYREGCFGDGAPPRWFVHGLFA
jgi:protein ImuB